jgi:putative Mg2+ transporter-C (MgtC) family protein
MTLTHAEMVLRMVTAILLGGTIGFERGRTDHPAGLRTHILVSLASATFMLVSTQFLYFQHYGNNPLIHVDPSRIASGVVMGIGFLGAGSIMRRGLDVHGLTTAASLWLVTAVGLAAGCGMFLEAFVATVGGLFVLLGLNVLEARFKSKVKRRLHLVIGAGGPGRSELIAGLRAEHIEVTHVDFDQDLKGGTTRLGLDVRLPNAAAVEPCLSRLAAIPGIRRVRMVDLQPPS